MGTGGDPSSIYTAKERNAHKVLLRARLAGISKPRRLTTHFFWAQENKETIKALKEAEEEEEEERPEKKKTKKKASKKAKAKADDEETEESEEESDKKKTNVLANHQALCKSEFEKLDDSEQKEWKELAELDRTEKSEIYTAITKGKSSITTPQSRQQ